MTVIKHVIRTGPDVFVGNEGVGQSVPINAARQFDSFSSAAYYQGEAAKLGCKVSEWRYAVLELTVHDLARRF